MTLLLGVDGCPGGWCAVALEVGDGRARPAGARVYSSVAEILASDAAVICIDIPIGLLDVPGQRRCDVEARRLLGPAWPRVFIPPCRQALGAPDDYIDALVCAWTAACVLQGTARRIPQEPEADERGLRMEMWLPAEPPNVAEPLQGSTGGGARVTRRF